MAWFAHPAFFSKLEVTMGRVPQLEKREITKAIPFIRDLLMVLDSEVQFARKQ